MKLQTIGFRRWVIVLSVIGLVYIVVLGLIFKGDASYIQQALTALLSFVGGFAAGVLGTRGQDDEESRHAPEQETDK